MTADRAVWRGQLLFLLIVASAVSLAAEGRLMPSLVLDGALAFAFMPLAQVWGFRAVWRVRAGHRATAEDLGGFLRGNGPWLWWWCAFAALVSIVPPRALGSFTVPVELSLLVPFVLTARRDHRWLVAEHARESRAAWIDVCALRLVIWGAAVTWFYGLAVWHRYASLVFPWIGA